MVAVIDIHDVADSVQVILAATAAAVKVAIHIENAAAVITAAVAITVAVAIGGVPDAQAGFGIERVVAHVL